MKKSRSHKTKPPGYKAAPTVTPLVSLCVIFRDNVETLPALLQSVDGHFDEFLFTDTGSVDGSRPLIEAFLRGRNGRITDFEWVDHFGLARQANFEAASGEWRFFLDSDDVLKGGGNLRAILRNANKHAGLQGVFFSYDYDLLEELQTLRCVKWGSTNEWSWATDAIHERLVAKTDPGQAGFAQVPADQLVVVHRRKTAADKEVAVLRNSAIAERDYAITTDLDYKARLARTIAMAFKLRGDLNGAEPFLREVGLCYAHLPEGKQAYSDLSRIAASRGDFEKAMDHAIKAGPSYEAIVLHAQGRHEDTIHRQTLASVMPPQTTHEGFFFEKVVAPMCLADSALKLGYPAAAIEQVLNSVRADLRVHPVVADATFDIRLDIDRLTILVPGTPQPFDGASTGQMLGGSEEAVVYLARALAKQGRNVRIFGTLPPLTVAGLDHDGVDWQPYSAFKLHDEHGTVVIWRAVGLVKQIMTTVRNIIDARKAGDEKAISPTGMGRSSLWLHDQSVGFVAEEAAALMGAVNSVVVLSDHHRRVLERNLPVDHKVPFVKLSNGIVRADFEALDWTQRDPNRVVYSSCPSRGLRVLLKLWPKIKAACPKAYLDIYYDWAGVRNFQPALHQDLMGCLESVAGLDVKHHGGVGHKVLHEALAGANIWAYSHYESIDVETFAISAVKATAAGATVITAPNGALPEVAPDSIFVANVEDYADEVIHQILNPDSDVVRRDYAAAVMDRFDWDAVATRFSQEWTVKHGRDGDPDEG